MLDPLERRLILGCCVALLAAFSYGAWQGRKADKVADAIVAADVKHDVAIVEAAKGEIYDQTIAASEQKVQAAKAKVARAYQRLAPVPPVVEISPSHAEPKYDMILVDIPDARMHEPSRAVSERDLVASQAEYITLLEGKVLNLTLARDAWRNSAQASQQEAVQLRAVIAAQQGLIKGALLKGRIQGFAVGFGSGYLTGKL